MTNLLIRGLSKPILEFNIPISIKTMEDLESIEKYCKDLLKDVLKGRTTE